MKRITVGILLFFVLVSSYSCVLNSGEKVPPKTSFGYYVYSKTAHEVVTYYISAMDIVLKLNEWVNAPDDQTRYQIEDKYFPSYKVRLDGDICTVLGVASVKMDEIAFAQVGSKWTFTRLGFGRSFDIECIEDGVWEINDESAEIESYTSTIELVVSYDGYNNASEGYDFVIKGKGNYYADAGNGRYYFISYDITREANVAFGSFRSEYGYNTLSSYIFYKGAMDLIIERSWDKSSEEVGVDMSLGNMNYEKVKIDYRGFSELW